MACHRQLTIFLLAYFLLSSCLCSQPTRSRRQKRGIMKMMLHMMWDPVRLIRYWYAYDVTWEIAKSWRKILPTILLLPFTQNMPHSHGFAKYVHPTGVRDYSKSKMKLKHPRIPVTSYQGSAGSVKPVAIPPKLLHQVLPSRYSYIPQYADHHISSKGIESVTQYKHQKVPHVIVGHVPYDDDKEDGNQYSIAHYFLADDTSREEVPSSKKIVFFSGPVDPSGTDEDISSASSQHVPSSSYKKMPHYVPSSEHEKNYFHYVPHVAGHQAAIKNENGEESSPILHPGQEFHIVLHPIPINDFDPDSLKPPTDGQAIQFVPVRSQTNESQGMDFKPSPILFKAVSLNSVDDSHKMHATDTSATDDLNIIRVHLNSSEISVTEEKQNATSSEDTKTRVTWIPLKSANLSRRTDQKESDLEMGGTIKTVVSVHSNTPQIHKFDKNGSNRFTPKRYSINIDRLREDLKHGTPVLIPFNKNTYSSDIPSDTDLNNPVTFQPTTNQYLEHELRSMEQSSVSKVEKAPTVIETSLINTSSEQSAESNSSQRLVLFLKKRKNS